MPTIRPAPPAPVRCGRPPGAATPGSRARRPAPGCRRLGFYWRIRRRDAAHRHLDPADRVVGRARQNHRADEQVTEKFEPLIERGDPRLGEVEEEPMLGEKLLDL